MLIQAKHLTHIYAPQTPLARTALRDVSLEIHAGQRVGIIGATGSGKSTLVQLFAGLLKPTAGQALLDGTPAHPNTKTARGRRSRIGMAFQYPEDQIFERTVFREVAFGLSRSARGKRAQIATRDRGTANVETATGRQQALDLRARVHWALDQVGLDPTAIAHRSPLTLSGGEMRRVALASVICTRPEVLILDEPTAGLDPRGQRMILSNIKSWGTLSTDTTLIVVSHNLIHLSRLVDRVIVLAQGCIAADGLTRDILSDPDLLQTAGLDVPPPVELLHTLCQAGWPVRTDLISPQSAAAEIARAQKQREDA